MDYAHRCEPTAEPPPSVIEFCGVLEGDLVAVAHVLGHVGDRPIGARLIKIEDQMVRRAAVGEATIGIEFRCVLGAIRRRRQVAIGKGAAVALLSDCLHWHQHK